MHVNHGADIGPQAQDLSIQVVPDAGRQGAVEQPRGRDVGDDDVVGGHLLQRDLGVLGVGDAVGETGVGHTDGKIPQ
jgi:hypothetical protein